MKKWINPNIISLDLSQTSSPSKHHNNKPQTGGGCDFDLEAFLAWLQSIFGGCPQGGNTEALS